MSRWHALAFVILILITGCARYSPKPLLPSETLSCYASRTLDDPGLTEFAALNSCLPAEEWPPQAWGLDELILAGFYYHPSLHVARSSWSVAIAGIKTAAMRPNPTFAFVPQYNKEPSVDTGGLTPQQSSPTSPWTFNQLLTIPIETAGKRKIRIARSEWLAKASCYSFAQAVWRVRSGVRKGLLTLFATSESERLLQQQEVAQEELVLLLGGQQSQGEIALLELNLATIGFQETALSLKEMQKQQAEALAELANAVGVALPAVACLSLSFERFCHLASPESASWSICKSRALLNRSDLLALLAEYEASQQALRLEIAKQIPDLNIGPGYNWDQGTQEWLLGFIANLPIMNQNQGPIAEACARREVAASRFRALQAQVVGEVEIALAGYLAVLDKLECASALMESQERQFRYAGRLFAAGEMGRVYYITARSNQLAARIAYFNTLIEAQQSLGQLEEALQCPVELDLLFAWECDDA